MKSIDMDNAADIGFQVISAEDGYLILVGSRCVNSSVDCIGFLKMDAGFDSIIYKKQHHAFPQELKFGSSRNIVIASNRYYITGAMSSESQEFQLFLMEFDPATGDSLWTTVRGEQYRDFTRAAVASSDTTLALINFKQISNNQFRIVLEQLDLEGNVFWESVFGQQYSYINPQSLAKLSNGDLLLTYSTCSIPNASSLCSAEGYDLTMTRTDAEGNEIWTHNYPVSVWNVSSQVLAVDDGGFVVSWARDFWFELDSLIAFPPSVLWFNAQGELTNSYYFPSNDHQRVLINLYRASNGDIIGAGRAHLGDEDLGLTGWIFRLSPQGELLWERNIADLRLPAKRSWFNDVIEMPDGSLVFVGLISDTFPNNIPVATNTNVWVVKLDSDGCLEPDCGTYQVITSTTAEVVPTGSPELRIYPNPTRGAFQVSMEGFQQPLYPAVVALRDMNGRLVRQVEQSGNADIDIAGLPAGIYVVQVRTAAGQVGAARVVVVR